ncbi:MAG: trypsin-like peptidase domain-containing protein [Acidimicrobiia bacterium]|nr:trypsin-like peptidase domain-containing protein [Acidimicrobiia bacterium]
MSVRRSLLYAGLTFSLASLAFSLGSWTAQRSMQEQLADNDARLIALQHEVARGILETREAQAGPSGTDGRRQPEVVTASGSGQSALVDEIKRQLQSEMGLMPVRLLRERRESFVELNAVDNFGKTSYGTAGYLGNGYFITVKHGVIALDDASEGREARRIVSVKIRYRGRDVAARVVDSGDAQVEVHSGDWAIIRVRENLDLPALRIDTSYGYEFAEPIFRLGNDYSKGIILGTGYVGQRTSNGLVTCLTDGHPGVSGGGVLNQEGDLVGIPIGRMQGDYRFSFILPVRAEMFRKVPGLIETATAAD